MSHTDDLTSESLGGIYSTFISVSREPGESDPTHPAPRGDRPPRPPPVRVRPPRGGARLRERMISISSRNRDHTAAHTTRNIQQNLEYMYMYYMVLLSMY